MRITVGLQLHLRSLQVNKMPGTTRAKMRTPPPQGRPSGESRSVGLFRARRFACAVGRSVVCFWLARRLAFTLLFRVTTHFASPGRRLMVGGIKAGTFEDNPHRLVDLAQRFLAALRATVQWRIAKLLGLLKPDTTTFTPVGINWHNHLKLFKPDKTCFSQPLHYTPDRRRLASDVLRQPTGYQ